MAALTVAILRGLIRLYQLFIVPVLPRACRFEPSCSHYTSQALSCHGIWQGTRLGLARIIRCHPWGGSGYDPVPEKPHSRSAITVRDQAGKIQN